MQRNQIFSLVAVSAFGLEGPIAAELKRLGMHDVKAENGLVRFHGTILDAYRCNLSLRFSDRVYLLLQEKTCLSFEDLFQLILAVEPSGALKPECPELLRSLTYLHLVTSSLSFWLWSSLSSS